MNKPKCIDAQIMAILKLAENGAPVADLCREHGMSSASFHIYGCLSRRKASLVINWQDVPGCKHLSGVADQMARPNWNSAW